MESLISDELILERSKIWSDVMTKFCEEENFKEIDFNRIQSEIDSEEISDDDAPERTILYNNNKADDDNDKDSSQKKNTCQALVKVDNFEGHTSSDDFDECASQTRAIIKEQQKRWQKSGMVDVLETFDLDKISEVVVPWLEKNRLDKSRLSSSIDEHIVQIEETHHRQVHHGSDSDSLHSLDTANYIRSSRKNKRSTSCTTTTIKKFSFVKGSKSSLLKKYGLHGFDLNEQFNKVFDEKKMRDVPKVRLQGLKAILGLEKSHSSNCTPPSQPKLSPYEPRSVPVQRKKSRQLKRRSDISKRSVSSGSSSSDIPARSVKPKFRRTSKASPNKFDSRKQECQKSPAKTRVSKRRVSGSSSCSDFPKQPMKSKFRRNSDTDPESSNEFEPGKKDRQNSRLSRRSSLPDPSEVKDELRKSSKGSRTVKESAQEIPTQVPKPPSSKLPSSPDPSAQSVKTNSRRNSKTDPANQDKFESRKKKPTESDVSSRSSSPELSEMKSNLGKSSKEFAQSNSKRKSKENPANQDKLKSNKKKPQNIPAESNVSSRSSSPEPSEVKSKLGKSSKESAQKNPTKNQDSKLLGSKRSSSPDPSARSVKLNSKTNSKEDPASQDKLKSKKKKTQNIPAESDVSSRSSLPDPPAEIVKSISRRNSKTDPASQDKFEPKKKKPQKNLNESDVSSRSSSPEPSEVKSKKKTQIISTESDVSSRSSSPEPSEVKPKLGKSSKATTAKESAQKSHTKTKEPVLKRSSSSDPPAQAVKSSSRRNSKTDPAIQDKFESKKKNPQNSPARSDVFQPPPVSSKVKPKFEKSSKNNPAKESSQKIPTETQKPKRGRPPKLKINSQIPKESKFENEKPQKTSAKSQILTVRSDSESSDSSLDRRKTILHAPHQLRLHEQKEKCLEVQSRLKRKDEIPKTTAGLENQDQSTSNETGFFGASIINSTAVPNEDNSNPIKLCLLTPIKNKSRPEQTDSSHTLTLSPSTTVLKLPSPAKAPSVPVVKQLKVKLPRVKIKNPEEPKESLENKKPEDNSKILLFCPTNLEPHKKNLSGKRFYLTRDYFFDKVGKKNSRRFLTLNSSKFPYEFNAYSTIYFKIPDECEEEDASSDEDILEMFGHEGKLIVEMDPPADK